MTSSAPPPDGWYSDETDAQIERWWAEGRPTPHTRDRGTSPVEAPASVKPGRSKKADNIRVLAIIAAIIVVFIGVAEFRNHRSGGTGGTGTSADSPGIVAYEGSASTVNVSITTSTGTTTKSNVPNGGFISVPAGQDVVVTVQDAQDDNQTVGCHISSADGTVISRNTADGADAIASCDGTP